MKQHVYRVDGPGASVRYIAATNKARALSFAAQTSLQVTRAEALEVGQAVAGGKAIEDADAEPAQQAES